MWSFYNLEMGALTINLLGEDHPTHPTHTLEQSFPADDCRSGNYQVRSYMRIIYKQLRGELSACSGPSDPRFLLFHDSTVNCRSIVSWG